jgi:hypothetical protein
MNNEVMNYCDCQILEVENCILAIKQSFKQYIHLLNDPDVMTTMILSIIPLNLRIKKLKTEKLIWSSIVKKDNNQLFPLLLSKYLTLIGQIQDINEQRVKAGLDNENTYLIYI